MILFHDLECLPIRPCKGGEFHSFKFPEIQNTASFEVVKTIKINEKFFNRKIFAKLNKNISKTFLDLKIHF